MLLAVFFVHFFVVLVWWSSLDIFTGAVSSCWKVLEFLAESKVELNGPFVGPSGEGADDAEDLADFGGGGAGHEPSDVHAENEVDWEDGGICGGGSDFEDDPF